MEQNPERKDVKNQENLWEDELGKELDKTTKKILKFAKTTLYRD